MLLRAARQGRCLAADAPAGACAATWTVTKGFRRCSAGETYLRTVAAAKAGAPGMHVHAFSPLEVWHGARSLGWPLARFLRALADAGLGSLPGTAAEVLCDDVRAAICPDKLTTAQWLQVECSLESLDLQGSARRRMGGVRGSLAWATTCAPPSAPTSSPPRSGCR